MMIVNMFVMMASSLCSFIDNLIISRVLGTDALAGNSSGAAAYLIGRKLTENFDIFNSRKTLYYII